MSRTTCVDDSDNRTPGCFGCLRQRCRRSGSVGHSRSVVDSYVGRDTSREERRRASSVSSNSCSISLDSDEKREDVSDSRIMMTSYKYTQDKPDQLIRNDTGSMYDVSRYEKHLAFSTSAHEQVPRDDNATSTKKTFEDNAVDVSDDEIYYSQEKDLIMDQMASERYKIQSQQSRQSELLQQRISEFQSTSQKMEALMRQADVNNRLQNADRERQSQLIKIRLEDRKRRIKCMQKTNPVDQVNGETSL